MTKYFLSFLSFISFLSNQCWLPITYQIKSKFNLAFKNYIA